MFYIEEVSEDEALYAYKSNCIYDELLEFYAFLNVWAVKDVGDREMIEEYYLDNDSVIDRSDELYERVAKMLEILKNIERLILDAQLRGPEQLRKCKDEMVE